MFFPIYLLISLCVVFSDQIHAKEEVELEVPVQDNAIDLVTSCGLHLKFPYFSPDYKTMDAQLRQHVLTDVTETLSFFNQTISDKLDKEGDSFKWASFSKNLISIAMAQNKRSKGIFEKITIIDKFISEGFVLFKRLLLMSKQKAKELEGEQIDQDQLKKLLQDMLSSLLEGFESSPVALFVDFSKGKVDDTPFEEYGSMLMAQLRHKGFGGLLGSVDFLLNIIARFKLFRG